MLMTGLGVMILRCKDWDDWPIETEGLDFDCDGTLILQM